MENSKGFLISFICLPSWRLILIHPMLYVKDYNIDRCGEISSLECSHLPINEN
jgi:hypothetical protein